MDIGVQAALRRHDDRHAVLDCYRDEVGNDLGSGGLGRITAVPAGQPGAPVSGLPVHR